MAVFIPIQIIVYAVWPPPSTVVGWFTLFQSNSIVGLLDMDLVLIVDQALLILVILTLYVALRRVCEWLMTIALVFGLVGTTSYFASATAFEMLSLSAKYAAATSDAERSIFLAAGEARLAVWQGTAFDVGYVLAGIALLLIAVVMLRSTVFSKKTAHVGILLGVLSLVPASAGAIGLVFAFGSLVPLEIWNVLVGRRLYELGSPIARR
jgi:hypothetical protein